MELIDLSNCKTDEGTELKKASLRAFLLSCKDYDIKKISIKLNVSISIVREWIVELTPSKFDEKMKIEEKVRIFKLENNSFSQREIAKHFGITASSVNKYLKNLQ